MVHVYMLCCRNIIGHNVILFHSVQLELIIFVFVFILTRTLIYAKTSDYLQC